MTSALIGDSAVFSGPRSPQPHRTEGDIMPYRHLPNTDEQRLAALNGAAGKASNVSDPADLLLTPEQAAALDLTNTRGIYAVFKRDVEERGTALSRQSAVTEEHDLAAAALGQFVSHFIQVFNFAVARGRFPRSARAHYGIDVSHSDVPAMTSHADFRLWADRIVSGEAARVAAGGEPMAMPSADEVATAIATFDEVAGRHTAAKDSYGKEQRDVETNRPAVDTLILDMWDTIEFRLRALDGPSRRRRAREWGLVYLTRPDETPDPDAGTTQPAPLSPGATTPPSPASPSV
jgi:hypothetical protein